MEHGIETKLVEAGYTRIEAAEGHAIGAVMVAREEAHKAVCAAFSDAWFEAFRADVRTNVYSSPLAVEADRIGRLRDVLGEGTLKADLLPFGRSFDQAAAAEEIAAKIGSGSQVIVICNGEAGASGARARSSQNSCPSPAPSSPWPRKPST